MLVQLMLLTGAAAAAVSRPQRFMRCPHDLRLRVGEKQDGNGESRVCCQLSSLLGMINNLF